MSCEFSLAQAGSATTRGASFASVSGLPSAVSGMPNAVSGLPDNGLPDDVSGLPNVVPGLPDAALKVSVESAVALLGPVSSSATVDDGTFTNSTAQVRPLSTISCM